MTLREIEKILAGAGIEAAKHEAMLIAARVSGRSAASLLAEPELLIDDGALVPIVTKRRERYPLQYLLGEWEFCGLDFKVTPDCLIPRADSEILAEEAARRLSHGGRILDLCTGTGCILASALKLSGNTHGYAVELYPAAAEVARENFARHSLTVELTVGDATTDLYGDNEKFDVITANPPYVTAAEMEKLDPEPRFEPRTALTDGGNGLSIIRAIIKIYRSHLADGGVMLIEHGAYQSAAVGAIADEYAMDHETLRDYGGHDRVAVLTRR